MVAVTEAIAVTGVVVGIVATVGIVGIVATAVVRCLGVFRAVAVARRWALGEAASGVLREASVGLQVVLVGLRVVLAVEDLVGPRVGLVVLREAIGAADSAR